MKMTDMSAQKATGSIRNQAIDLMKLVLSVFVVLIHAEVDLGIATPLLRTAVPLFFMTSGYFFFRKIGNDRAKDLPILWKFLKRNLILYGFWFVALLPITLYVRGWFKDSVVEGVVLFVKDLLFNSTFRASWYLMALNIGVILIYFMSRKLRPVVLVCLTAPVYLICCLFTNYYGLAQSNETVMDLYRSYLAVFGSLVNGFPAALFWLALGNMFTKVDLQTDKGRLLLVMIVSGLLLMGEHLLVRGLGLQGANDCYLMLIPVCVAFFCYIQNTKLGCGKKLRMGHLSTIIYTSHASVITVVGAVLRRVLSPTALGLNWLVFGVSLMGCLCICSVIFYLEKKKGFRWLRYAY
jgi:peptidoglycan/LPS O-acetylase OafA/YrhL